MFFHIHLFSLIPVNGRSGLHPIGELSSFVLEVSPLLPSQDYCFIHDPISFASFSFFFTPALSYRHLHMPYFSPSLENIFLDKIPAKKAESFFPHPVQFYSLFLLFSTHWKEFWAGLETFLVIFR